jgi:hypothetical protein
MPGPISSSITRQKMLRRAFKSCWGWVECGVDRVVDVDFEANLARHFASVLKNGGVIAAYRYASSRGNRATTPAVPIYALVTHNISIQTLRTYTRAEMGRHGQAAGTFGKGG